MTDDDKFLERLRGDAAPLRYQVDDATLARIRARIQARIGGETTVAAVLASWFRPLAAALGAVAVIAAISFAAIDSSGTAVGTPTVEIVVAGEPYVVGN